MITDENYNGHDKEFHGSWETEFDEGMKSILDVVHPDLTYPEKGEQVPPLLFPWRGNEGSGGILSNNTRNNVGSRRSSFSARGRQQDGRQ